MPATSLDDWLYDHSDEFRADLGTYAVLDCNIEPMSDCEAETLSLDAEELSRTDDIALDV